MQAESSDSRDISVGAVTRLLVRDVRKDACSAVRGCIKVSRTVNDNRFNASLGFGVKRSSLAHFIEENDLSRAAVSRRETLHADLT